MKTADYWTLGNNVRSFSMKRGLTQEALAEKANLSVKGIQKVEAGQGGIHMVTFMKISMALEVSMDILAGQETDEKRKYQQEAFCRLVEDKMDEEVEFAMEVVRMIFYLKAKYSN